MKHYIHLLVCLAGLLLCAPLRAQTHNASASGSVAAHRLTVGLGHTHISQGELEGDTKWLTLGSWSLNYDYWLSNRWAIGLQNDIVLESYKIEHGDQQVLERNYPISVVPVVLYKPFASWTFIGGAGVETSEGHTLGLTRLGIEYGLHLPHHWEAGIAAVWDNKWTYYNSWGLAFTFSKLWMR